MALTRRGFVAASLALSAAARPAAAQSADNYPGNRPVTLVVAWAMVAAAVVLDEEPEPAGDGSAGQYA